MVLVKTPAKCSCQNINPKVWLKKVCQAPDIEPDCAPDMCCVRGSLGAVPAEEEKH